MRLFENVKHWFKVKLCSNLALQNMSPFIPTNESPQREIAMLNVNEVEERAKKIAARATKVADSLGSAKEKFEELSQIFSEFKKATDIDNSSSGQSLNLPAVALETEQLSHQFKVTYDQMLVLRKEIIQLHESNLKLIENSKKIESILETTSEIAFQIKMLSFNAAIEAARAGEAGKSFAVVSQAVKDLADRTENATKQVQMIVEGNKVLTDIAASAAGNTLQIVEKTTNQTEASSTKIIVLSKAIRNISDKQSNDIPILQKSINEAHQAASANKNAPAELIPVATKIRDFLNGIEI